METYKVTINDATSYVVYVQAKSQEEAEKTAIDEVWCGRYDEVEEHPLYVDKCEKEEN